MHTHANVLSTLDLRCHINTKELCNLSTHIPQCDYHHHHHYYYYYYYYNYYNDDDKHHLLQDCRIHHRFPSHLTTTPYHIAI